MKTLRREQELSAEQNALLQAENENLQKTVSEQNELVRLYEITEKEQNENVQRLEAYVKKLDSQLLVLRHTLSAKGLAAHADLTDADIEEIIAANAGQPDVATAVENAQRILVEYAANVHIYGTCSGKAH